MPNKEGHLLKNIAVTNKDNATKKLLKKQDVKIRKAITDGM